MVQTPFLNQRDTGYKSVRLLATALERKSMLGSV